MRFAKLAVSSVLAASTLLAGSGCGVNHGFIRDSVTANEVQYRMNVITQRYVRSVSGSANYGSVLCVFPVNGDGYKRAMEDLYQSAQLRPNQTILNLREDHKAVSYVGFYCNWNVTVSGDVFEFTPGAPLASNGGGAS